MTDDRERLPDDGDREYENDPENGMERDAPTGDDYALLSTEDFDDELLALEQAEDEIDEYDDEESADEESSDADERDDDAASDDIDDTTDDAIEGDIDDSAQEMDVIAAYDTNAAAGDDEDETDAVDADETYRAEDEFADDLADAPESIDDDERLRGPRAQRFRRRRQNRIAFLPLALYLLVLGGYLIAREQNVENLREFTNLAIIGASVMMGAFTMIFHSLLSGRRERGLLVLGLWIGTTVGLIAALAYFVDDQPDAVEWWPLLVGALGLALFVNYMIERTHDARLLWLGFIALFAAGIAYAFTSDTIDEDAFSQIADYWPLLLSVIGIGVVPLVFRRHLE